MPTPTSFPSRITEDRTTSASASAPSTAPDLAERLEVQVARRTGGQVRDLRVIFHDDRVIMRGRSRTYHAKQIAQEAALDATGGWPVLVNEIEVS